PGPSTYTPPRLVGPNTAYIPASPCYSMAGRRKHHGLAEDLAKTPGPAAFPEVGLDFYKTRAPTYAMGTRAGLPGDRTLKPGPADSCLGKVRQLPASPPLLAPPPPRLPPFSLPLPGDAHQAPGTRSRLRHSLRTAP
ncbi:ODF3A protein, partial [Stercorarius parasiticus]|nr:ODF3A protein [Stercorarius parasiticus]